MRTSEPIHVVLGTAGHIDHGKTTLIQALTGVDTDRLPEEKKRGITIVLGFAPLDLPGGRRVGVVDVPGHERFVKNMVAGAGGIDMVLLVVAADEGVMPQTREHVEICELLGIHRGLVALTRIDRAGEELTELAIDDVRDYLTGTSLQDAQILPCSSITGEGLDAVRAEITRIADEIPPRRATSTFVLPVDRMFSVKGFGSVVTGTLLQNEIEVGDAVDIVPAVPGRPPPDTIRVRSVEVFHEKVERAYAGDRTALSLQGVDLEQLSRGQIMVTPGMVQPTRMLDVRLHYLGSRAKPLKTSAKAVFHIGTTLIGAGLTLLDADVLEPGSGGFARIRLDQSIAALPGQRFILRGFEALSHVGRTIAGGIVLDPEPPRRKRNTESTSATLAALDRVHTASANDLPDAKVAALTALLAESGAQGQQIEALARRLGDTPAAIEKALTRAAKTGAVAKLDRLAVHTAAIQALGDKVLSLIDGFHKEHPFREGMPLAELTSRLGKRIPTSVAERAARALVGMKKLSSISAGYHRPEHRPFGAAGAEARAKVLKLLKDADLAPPTLAGLETESGLEKKALRELMQALTRTAEVVRATPTLFFDAQAFERAKAKVITHLDEAGEITTAEAKGMLGISRKYLIPFLETLDKQRVTVRVGEARKRR